MDIIKVGIIGAGNIANCHIIAYQKCKDIEVVAVCDINRERAENFARQYSITHVYDNHLKMFEDETLDAVSVCVWNNGHAPVSIDALENGIHVLCEKPLATSTELALKMQQAAEEHGCILMPGFCTRYEDGIQLLKTYMDKKMFGNIYYVKATYLRRNGNPGGWFSDMQRSGGGPVIDLGVHVLDLARYISGGKAISVYAVTNKMQDVSTTSNAPHISIDSGDIHDVEDFASALIRMDNNITIQFETSWNHHVESDLFQFEVYGTKGGARAYPKVFIMTDMAGEINDFHPLHSIHEENPNYDFDKEIEHFINVIRGVEVPICNAEDGVEIMRITDAIYLSARERKEIRIER